MREKELGSVLRMIDANLNRAAEALRVVEDVCRFHWSLEGFAAELKQLRHSVLGALASDGAARLALLRHRDIAGDAGRATPSPGAPADAASLAARNLERAKEALRVLEECCKMVRPEAAPALQAARYRLYALEPGLGQLPPIGPGDARLREARLCLLASSSSCARPLEGVVEEAIEAGADVVQLREKSLPDREVVRLARKLRELTARRGILFIVNDRVDIALLSHADGVHLGQGDLSPVEARTLAARPILVGVSTHSVEQALAAEREGADYLGVGPMFPTSTKDAGPLLGPEGLREVLSLVSIPAFAIGGIQPATVAAVRAAGGNRIAVSSAILGAEDVGRTVSMLLDAPGR